uniref:Uncharacterized protein n=1 Tax=Siphoviridae sp. ctiJI15 TaxID=2826431 RepID=A0A8S5NKD9_9CAUD|nr:MAG TPA: hypothetical protein [Siphoviridae sp. ctiJI15]
MEDVVENEVMKELIISKEDFKNCFYERKIITKQEYKEYLKNKNKSSDKFPDFFPTQF